MNTTIMSLMRMSSTSINNLELDEDELDDDNCSRFTI